MDRWIDTGMHIGTGLRAAVSIVESKLELRMHTGFDVGTI